MINSATAKQAFRTLMAMAGDEPTRTWRLQELADAAQVGAPYLGRTLRRLAQAGIVQMKRGRGGGVTLGRSPDRVSLYQVLDALGVTESYSQCALRDGQCSDDDPCALHATWTEVRRRLITYMKTTTLDELT
ncbi:MAG: RrF2 family transcriptional regulator [Armatimonadota bacterium]